MKIGDRIKDRRKQLRMSADDLAKKLGKDRSTIYRYEKGEIENIPADILIPIAKALDTTPQALIGWEDSSSVFVDITEDSPYSSTVITSNPWMARNQQKWFELTRGFEFTQEELGLFYDCAKFIMASRDAEEYQDKLKLALLFFKQLNK
jgi:transcriptional regulator with XRE-family HTH domain